MITSVDNRTLLRPTDIPARHAGTAQRPIADDRLTACAGPGRSRCEWLWRGIFAEVGSSHEAYQHGCGVSEASEIEDALSRLQAWTTEYEAAHRDVFDVYYRSYGDPCSRNGAVADVPRISPLVQEWEARAEALARQTEQEFSAQGLLDELNVVLLVGNHTANAWMDEFHGRQTMFVALEFWAPRPTTACFSPTEALHLAHMHHGAANWPDDVASHLIQEGLATAATRNRHPGLSDSGYLWNDDHHDSWVRECRAEERALAAVVLDEMATPADAAHVRGLFGPDCQAGTLPPRLGYWLGDLLAQHWLSQHNPRDVLGWNHAEATDRASNDLRTRLG